MKKMAQEIIPPDLPSCPYCNKKFTTKEYLAQHIKNRHRERYDDYIKGKTPKQVHKYNELP